MKFMLVDGKGISPIISSVMMTAIVVMLSAVVVIWGTNTFNVFQSRTEFFFTSRSEALRERFVIEHVQFGVDKVTVYVRNVGAIEITVASIYVSNVDGSQSVVGNPETEVLVNERGEMVVSGWSPNSGATYQILVATTRGNKVVEFWTNPSS